MSLSVIHSSSCPGRDHQYTFMSPSVVLAVAAVWYDDSEKVSFSPNRVLSVSEVSTMNSFPAFFCSSARSAGLAYPSSGMPRK